MTLETAGVLRPPEGKEEEPPKPLLPTLKVALRALFSRDTITQSSLLLVLMTWLVHLAGVEALLAEPPFYRIGTAFATLLMLVAALADRDRVDQREAPFWRAIAIAIAQLAGVALVRLTIAALKLPVTTDLYRGLLVAAELLRLGGLITLLLAVHSRPHEPSRQKLAHYERSAGLPTALLLAFCAVLYFGVVPVAHDGELSRLGLVLSLSLLPINVYLVGRCLVWAIVTPQPRWQCIYLLLGLSLAIFPLSLMRMSSGQLGFEISFAGELLGCGLAILAIRLRHYRFPVVWQREVPAHPAEARINPGSRSLLLATMVPVLHLLGYRLNFFEESLRPAREHMLVLWMLIAALASAAQHRRSRKLAAELVAERRRIEASLLRSERDLQLAEERRRADEALIRSREKYQRAFRASPYALLITSTEDGRLVEFNDRFLELLGYERSEALGRTTLELGIWANPEERNRFLAELRENGRVEDFEVDFRRSDGLVHRAIANAEMLELQGKPCMLAIARDRTLDEQREERRKALVDVFLGTATPILAIDEDERLIAANSAAESLLGVKAGETGRLGELLPDRAQHAKIMAARVEAIQRGSAKTEIVLAGPQGPRRYTVHLLETADRDLPVAFLVLFVDREQSEQILSNP